MFKKEDDILHEISEKLSKDRELRDRILDISFSIAIFSLEEWEFNKRLGSPFIENIKREGRIFHDAEYRRENGTLKISS